MSMRANFITADLTFSLKVLIVNKKRIHILNISNCTLYIVKFFIGFDTLFWPIFVDFRNEVVGLCVSNSITKELKRTFMVSWPNLKSYLCLIQVKS